jgi:hypothetical protein
MSRNSLSSIKVNGKHYAVDAPSNETSSKAFCRVIDNIRDDIGTKVVEMGAYVEEKSQSRDLDVFHVYKFPESGDTACILPNVDSCLAFKVKTSKGNVVVAHIGIFDVDVVGAQSSEGDSLYAQSLDLALKDISKKLAPGERIISGTAIGGTDWEEAVKSKASGASSVAVDFIAQDTPADIIFSRNSNEVLVHGDIKKQIEKNQKIMQQVDQVSVKLNSIDIKPKIAINSGRETSSGRGISVS